MKKFKADELVFAIDVTSQDHDVANFEFHEGSNLVLKQAVTCGNTNKTGQLPGYQKYAFAVDLGEPDDLQSLIDALTAMLQELNKAKEAVATRSAEKSSASARKSKRASGEP